jgi:hypothetical protein
MGVRSRHGDRLVVQWTCAVCGLPFALASDVSATEIPNRMAFLDTHRACLRLPRSGRAIDPGVGGGGETG